jgi:hypothetical protein
MDKAGRGGDGAPRGPVLHIVVVGFHHKKGCQVRTRSLALAGHPLPCAVWLCSRRSLCAPHPHLELHWEQPTIWFLRVS